MFCARAAQPWSWLLLSVSWLSWLLLVILVRRLGRRHAALSFQRSCKTRTFMPYTEHDATMLEIQCVFERDREGGRKGGREGESGGRRTGGVCVHACVTHSIVRHQMPRSATCVAVLPGPVRVRLYSIATRLVADKAHETLVKSRKRRNFAEPWVECHGNGCYTTSTLLPAPPRHHIIAYRQHT